MTTFVENTFALSTKLLKKSLKKAREKEPVEGEFLNYSNNGKASALDYSVEYYDDKDYLVIFCAEEPQRILLQEHKLKFGTRSYLTCKCEKRVNALYLKKGIFKCRKCQNIHYVSTMVCHTSGFWKRMRKSIQILKLMEIRKGINRPYYKSLPTKRFLRWLGLWARAGMFDELIKDLERTRCVD